MQPYGFTKIPLCTLVNKNKNKNSFIPQMMCHQGMWASVRSLGTIGDYWFPYNLILKFYSTSFSR